MHAVIVGPDPHFLSWLQERSSLGLDHRDEVWDGVLHVVPPTTFNHQEIELELTITLRTIARSCGLIAVHQAGVFFEAGFDRENYRTPDVVVVDREFVSKRGVERRAELVVEVLSPGDESRQKFSFYASCGIPEYWLVDPMTREVEIYVLRDGAYERQPPRDDGTIEAPRLGLTVRVIDGPKLRIDWTGGSAEI
jgi:Uma2 family endonuclease